MRLIMLMVLLVPLTSLAQFGPSRDSDTIGGDPTETYFDFGPNFSIFGQSNVSLNGATYDYTIDGAFFGFDDEPIDEIIVTAKRRVDRGWHLWMFVQWNLDGKEVCTNWTDGGHCNATIMEYDPEAVPIAGGCQAHSGTSGALTGEEANALNVDYVNEQNIDNALFSISSTSMGYLIGGQVGALVGVAGSVVTIANGFVDELPFTAGDVVEWELTVCNDGQGGVNSDLSVTIN